MKRPSNMDRPFFAYGLFRPGQLAFFRLRDLVRAADESASIAGELRLRDGLPILDPEGRGSVSGALLTFRPEQTAQAYDCISGIEPDKHYRWAEAQVGGEPANVLVGRSPRKGSERCEDVIWDGWNDPLFTDALDVVEEALDLSQACNPGNLKPLFRLQMAYLLLWSAIERYVSLRYHLGNGVLQKIDNFAGEPAFAESLRQHVTDNHKDRTLYRADRPAEKEVLDPESPEKAAHYYYQVRCNITHRGKGVVKDYERVKDSLAELLPIFRDVLMAAQREAACRSAALSP